MGGFLILIAIALFALIFWGVHESGKKEIEKDEALKQMERAQMEWQKVQEEEAIKAYDEQMKQQAAQAMANSSAPTSSNTDYIAELAKFKELLDMGVITQEEFDAKKKQLLGL